MWMLQRAVCTLLQLEVALDLLMHLGNVKKNVTLGSKTMG